MTAEETPDETPAAPKVKAPAPPAEAEPEAPAAAELPEGVSDHTIAIGDDGTATVDLPLFENGIRAVTDTSGNPIAVETSTPAPGITRVVLSSMPKGDVVLRIVSNPTASH